MPYLVRSYCEQCNEGDEFTIGLWSQHVGVYICDCCKQVVNIPTKTGRCPGCNYKPCLTEFFDYAAAVPYFGEQASHNPNLNPACPKCQNSWLTFEICDHFDLNALFANPTTSPQPTLEQEIFVHALLTVCVDSDLDPTAALAYFGLTVPPLLKATRKLSRPIFIDIQTHLQAKSLPWSQPLDEHTLRRRDAAWLTKMAHLYARRLGRTEQAIRLYKRALRLAQTMADSALEHELLLNLGRVYGHTKAYRQAINTLEQALSVAQTHHNPAWQMADLFLLAQHHRAIGEIERPIELYEAALALAQQLEATAYQAEIYGHLGTIYRALGPLEQAVTLYQQAIDLTRALEDAAQEAFWLGNLGIAYSQQWHTLPQAKHCLEQALAIFARLQLAETPSVRDWLAQFET